MSLDRWSFTALLLAAAFWSGCLPSPGESDSPPAPFPGTRLVKQGVVLPVGSFREWDGGMVESPVVWYDSLRGAYGMVYTGYGSTDSTRRGYKFVTGPRVGLAWSDDLLHWRKDPRNPIFSGSGVEGTTDAAGASGPFLWAQGGTYYLFYFGVTGKGYEKGTKTLNVALSSDLVSWRRYEGNPIIVPSGPGWRRDAIWHPNIVRHGTTYYLFFNASGVVAGREEEWTGYATSEDLLHWTVDDRNSPVMTGSGTPGTWDASGRAGDPSVFSSGAFWYMAWYSWDRKNTSDGMAWTTQKDFPLGWRLYEHNPILRVGPPGSDDALHAGKPFVFRTGTTHYHFYTAVALDEKRQIAVATEPIGAPSR
jgi:predicted GH43/DUF377 family glycosyl hydrolase